MAPLPPPPVAWALQRTTSIPFDTGRGFDFVCVCVGLPILVLAMSFLHDCDLVGCEANQLRDNNINNLCDVYGLFGFKQLICEPTRVTLTTSSIIDHIATTNARNIMGSGANKVSLSDHYLVYCIRKFNGAVEKGHKMIKTPKMKNFSEEAFLADVSAICWEQMLTETDDINVLVNNWSSLFPQIIDKHAPIC